MRCFELVVFDWDGTLADSTGVIVTSLLNAFADLALPVPAVERARHVIGLGMADALAYMAPGLATSDYSRLADRYRWHFLKQKTELYPGTEKLLRGLRDRGYRLAVATGKSKRGLERSLSELALLQYFDGWRCADMCAPKPAPDMLNELI